MEENYTKKHPPKTLGNYACNKKDKNFSN